MTDASDGDEQLAAAVVSRLCGRTLGCAESLTGGRLAQRFTMIDNAAEWFRGSLVAYHPAVKRRVLRVTADTDFCQSTVAEMVAGALDLLDADIGIATSGIAGGDPIDGVTPGTVFIATNVERATRTATYCFDGRPAAICDQAVTQALRQLLEDLSHPDS